jgi:hypothetical protein
MGSCFGQRTQLWWNCRARVLQAAQGNIRIPTDVYRPISRASRMVKLKILRRRCAIFRSGRQLCDIGELSARSLDHLSSDEPTSARRGSRDRSPLIRRGREKKTHSPATPIAATSSASRRIVRSTRGRIIYDGRTKLSTTFRQLSTLKALQGRRDRNDVASCPASATIRISAAIRRAECGGTHHDRSGKQTFRLLSGRSTNCGQDGRFRKSARIRDRKGDAEASRERIPMWSRTRESTFTYRARVFQILSAVFHRHPVFSGARVRRDAGGSVGFIRECRGQTALRVARDFDQRLMRT